MDCAATPGADHVVISPSILYLGTPVVLITTLNPDGRANITPMSSAWGLGDRLVLGLGAASQGAENLLRDGQCVLNYPDATLWDRVERIARGTGRDPVPEYKQRMGFSHMPDKFEVGGFTRAPSDVVRPPRIAECPIQLEAERTGVYGSDDPDAGPRLIVEVKSLRVHARADLVPPGTDHIDPVAWRPLLYVFRHYFGTGRELGSNFRAGT